MNEPALASTARQPALFAISGPLAARLGAGFFTSLPAGPGVYRFFGEDGRLLYIGQSSNLRARVGSYRFVSAPRHSRRIVRMVARAFRAEWEPCATAEEAIAREAALLLEHSPPFNRAGVWQPPPWWLTLSAEGQTLHAGLVRERGESNVSALAPLPSGFRYSFGSLMRCLYHWQCPETAWWNLPCGMARPVIPPQQAVPLRTEATACLAAVGAFITCGCQATLETLTGWTAALNPDSAEGMFWTEDADTLRKFAARAGGLIPPPAQDGPA